MRRKNYERRRPAPTETPAGVEVVRYPGGLGLILVRTAAAVLYACGGITRIGPGWVDANVHIDKKHRTWEEDV